MKTNNTRNLKINLAILKLISILADIELAVNNFGTQMKNINVHSLINLFPTGIGSDLLSLRLPCGSTLLSVVLLKQINEQDRNYFGMT